MKILKTIVSIYNRLFELIGSAGGVLFLSLVIFGGLNNSRITRIEGDIQFLERNLNKVIAERKCTRLGGVYDEFGGSKIVNLGQYATYMAIEKCTKNGLGYKYDGTQWVIENSVDKIYLK